MAFFFFFFIASGPDRATCTGLIMLIYSNGVVIMWQAACCADCQDSNRLVITGTQHIHHQRLNNVTNEQPAGMMPSPVFTSEEKQQVIWWFSYLKCATFPPSFAICVLTVGPKRGTIYTSDESQPVLSPSSANMGESKKKKEERIGPGGGRRAVTNKQTKKFKDEKGGIFKKENPGKENGKALLRLPRSLCDCFQVPSLHF